jgi:arylsulfatase A-like enzyme
VATNTDDGKVIPEAVRAYLDADPLGPFGFSGWVGPEPHGAAVANCGVIRDPLIADRVIAWLEDRYARRRAGDEAARRPFLLVARFVNPHDIVLFPDWVRNSPMRGRERDVPHVPAPPTADEDLARKPAAQAAYRDAYYSAYGPARGIKLLYDLNRQRYRDLYYRLHAEVDGHIDRVRRRVTEGGSEHAVLVRTSDHGELLGAHGGLHQKWFNLYDEATRVPFVVVRVGDRPTTAKRVRRTPTSHVDVLPTLLAAAGLDVDALTRELAPRFTELHPLPGSDLMPLAEGDAPARAVYLQTRDNVFEGDNRASVVTRRLRLSAFPYGPLAMSVPADVGASFEAIVVAVDDTDGGRGHLWKLVRTFDDPATWTEPEVRHLASSRYGIEHFRSTPLPDEWELYDLDEDPIEAVNRWGDHSIGALRERLCARLVSERARCIAPRNRPWPYATRGRDRRRTAR